MRLISLKDDALWLTSLQVYCDPCRPPKHTIERGRSYASCPLRRRSLAHEPSSLLRSLPTAITYHWTRPTLRLISFKDDALWLTSLRVYCDPCRPPKHTIPRGRHNASFPLKMMLCGSRAFESIAILADRQNILFHEAVTMPHLL
jgi:hypothetical protein